MIDRSVLSPLAAVGIWVVSLIGSWVLTLAALGAMNGAVIGCEPDLANPGADGGVETGGWVILVVASLVPVLVMAAVAPAGLRTRLIGLAAVVAAVALVAANVWIGPCL
jgi:hypothetical protein